MTERIGGFAKYIRKSSRIIDKISVTTGGGLGFSTSFSNQHELQNYKGVVLYWNEYTKEIGIEFKAEEAEDTLKLIPNKNGYGFTVNAKNFFATNRIDTRNHHGRFTYKVMKLDELDPSYNNHRGIMYIFQLSETNGKEET